MKWIDVFKGFDLLKTKEEEEILIDKKFVTKL